MKRLLLLSAILVAGLIAWYLVPDPRQQKGEEASRRIEEFRQTHHRLPSSLSEVSIEESESGPIYYQRIGDQNYCVYYGTRLGESMTFNPITRKWTETNNCDTGQVTGLASK